MKVKNHKTDQKTNPKTNPKHEHRLVVAAFEKAASLVDDLHADSPKTEDLRSVVSQVDEDIQQRLKLSEVHRTITHGTGMGSSYEEILDSVFELFRGIVPFDRLGIATLEEQGSMVRLTWVKSDISIAFLDKGYAASLESTSLKKIIETGQPRIINDLVEYLQLHPDSKSTQLIVKDGICSSLTFPLISRGKPIGLIFFASRKCNTYERVHTEIFKEISEELAHIVEQGQLRRFFDENKDKDQYIRATVHDLKSPVGVIKGFLGILMEEAWYKNLDIENKNIFTIISRNCDNMLNLIGDLTISDLLRARELDLKKESVLVRPYLSELVKQNEELAAKKSIDLDLHIGDNVPQAIFFNPGAIQRVLQNLIDNAVKYSRPNTRVSIKVEALDNTAVYFKIRDQGVGIPEEELPRLFIEFGKTSAKPTGNESSTGLGLAIVRRMVEAHGGKVWAQSSQGQGSEFVFMLPVSDRSDGVLVH